jgi:hypothetical protein
MICSFELFYFLLRSMKKLQDRTASACTHHIHPPPPQATIGACSRSSVLVTVVPFAYFLPVLLRLRRPVPPPAWSAHRHLRGPRGHRWIGCSLAALLPGGRRGPLPAPAGHLRSRAPLELEHQWAHHGRVMTLVYIGNSLGLQVQSVVARVPFLTR